MRRLAFLSVVFGLALTGCNRGPTIVVVQQPPASPTEPAPAPSPPAVVPAVPVADLAPREKYDIAVWTAVGLLTDRKYPEALAALEQAQRIQDTDQVRQEIARLKVRMDAARAADRTTRDIQIVLNDGRPDDAGRLAIAALREFGDTDAADAIVRLKRQADALGTISLDRPARAARFRREGDEAVRDGNLRAAALAYDQCVIAGDATARPRLAELQATLTKYDDARRRAADLRRDPSQLDDALAALTVAAAAWDTPRVRQDIDECTLALQSRRDRLGVADFDSRGEVGSTMLGATIAEDLLPAFRGRFDVVERLQVGRVCDELKVNGVDLIDQEVARRELSRLAKIRYLVVGSVTRVGDIVVHARLLDLHTGLVVQSAKVSAATPSALFSLIPQLATMLQMSDDQRMAYEQQLARQASTVAVAADTLAIPPPPPDGATGPGSALFVGTTRPPDVGGVVIEDFRQLPPPVPPGQVVVGIQVDLSNNHKVRACALNVALELGDDLFRHGRYAEAHAQFQIALGLAPGHADVVARLDRCKKLLPQPVAWAQPAIVVRPRLAVLDFVSAGDPALAPPGLGTWAAETVAPYLSPPYDVADRSEVCWYMARLGMTLRDAVVDPVARLYLGRALNVRYIVLGTVEATPAGLNVVAHLLDTETGAEQNVAAAVARDRGELKCRLGEIARWLLLDPAERLRREAEAAETQALLVQAEAAAKQSNFGLAIELAKKAGHKTPGIRVEVLLNQFDRAAQFAALETQRRAAWDQQQAAVAAALRRQQELAAAAEAARVAAAAQAAAVDAAERQRQRDLACQQLLAQARAAREAQNFSVAIQLYDSALAIDRRADVARDLADLRVHVEDQARARVAMETAAREAAQRQERLAGVARAQTQLEAERRQRAAADQARRQAQEQADARLRADAEARSRMDSTARAKADADAKRQAEARVKVNVDAKALADAEAKHQAEARVKAVNDAEAKRQADVRARADADAKARADADAKARAAADQAARDAEVRRRQQDEQQRRDNYTRLMSQGRTALTGRKFDDAQRAFADALKVQPNDPEATRALKQAQDAARPAPPSPPPPPPPPPTSALSTPPKSAGPPPPSPVFIQQMQAGANWEKEEKYADALKAYQAALKVVPTDPTALKRAEYVQHMSTGVATLKAGKKPDAVVAFEAALKIAPKDPAATKWLQQARQ